MSGRLAGADVEFSLEVRVECVIEALGLSDEQAGCLWDAARRGRIEEESQGRREIREEQRAWEELGVPGRDVGGSCIGEDLRVEG